MSKPVKENIQYSDAESFVNSIIGEGTTLRGDFDLNGLLRIDGSFFGKVKTNGKVLIGKNGVAECEIFAGTVVIGGKVKGEVIAMERITLLSTGELIGNIKTPRLIIEEGVIFDGKCEIIENKDRLEQIKTECLEKYSVSQPVGLSSTAGMAPRKAQKPADKEIASLNQGITDTVKQKVT